MADLIEREKSISLFLTALTFKERTGKLTWTTAEMKQWIADCMEELPAVDAVEVRHGRWIEDGYYDDNTVCSNCGTGRWKGFVPSVKTATEWLPRCPWCGAVMDGKDGNDGDLQKR